MKTQTRIGTLALTLALLTGLAPRTEAGVGYQMPITFSGYTNRNEALTNFPVLVVFSNGVGQSGFSFSNYPFATANGYDLRFYTNSTGTGDGLDYEIESWTPPIASPTNIPGCRLWLDGSDLDGDGLSEGGSETYVNAGVATWKDKSGAGNDFVNNASSWPTQSLAVVNGRDALSFNGSSTYLTKSGGVLAAGDDDYEIVAVWYPKVSTGLQRVYEQYASGNNNMSALLANNAAYGFNGENNDKHDLVPFSANAWILTDMKIDNSLNPGNVNINHNGTNYVGTTTAPGSLNVGTTACSIGRKYNAANEYLNGHLAELIVFTNTLNAAQRIQIGYYLQAKYGLSVGYGAAGYVWVKIPTLATNGASSIYARWGDGSASSQLPCTTNGAAWAEGYVGVWHLPDGTILSGSDSSPNANTAGNSNGVTAVAGKVDGGANFASASSQYLRGNKNTGLSGNLTATIESWVNLADTATGGTGPALGDGTGSLNAFALMFNVRGTGVVSAEFAGNNPAQSAVSPLAAGTWYHIAAIKTPGAINTTTKVLINGVDYGLGGTPSTSTPNVTDKPPVAGRFGAYNGNYLKGQMDEVRVSSVVRSTNWVWATYQNMASNAAFSTYGTVASVSPYKLKMAFTNYTAAEVLTNFPVLVTFSNGLYGTFNYNTFTAPASGGDLRFMDSTENSFLDFEIEKWDTNGASYAWVRVPQLSSSTTIYAKWGGADTNLPACATNGAVWTNQYAAVYHLATTGGVRSAADATRINDGSVIGTVGTVTGQIDGGASFTTSGNNDIAVPDHASLRITSKLTLSAWVNQTSRNSNGGLVIQKRHATTHDGGSENYAMWVGPNGELKFELQNPAGTYQSLSSGNNAVPIGSWAHLTFAIDESAADGVKLRTYVNGAEIANFTAATTPAYANTMPADCTQPLQMGNYGGMGGGVYQLNGSLDEVRVSALKHSSNWIYACYLNQASNAFFNGYGTVIAPNASTAPPQIQNQSPTGVGTNGATFNGKLLINGFENAAVYVAWGQTNGVWTTTNWWASGAWANGSSPSTNLALSANANYYYTFGATNSLTNVVASGYQYLITGEVTVQPTDPTGRVASTDTAAFTLYRPASCTNEDLTVAYTLGGTAISGTHYTNSPAASGTSGTVTIPAGQTNAVVTVYPRSGAAPQQTVVLSLASGPYAIGSANAATCTLAAVDLTLTANAWLNLNGQLTNATQGVLATATSGSGSQADPYVFDVANMNLGTYTIFGNTANNANQYSATWRVAGNVTGTGNLDSYTTANNTYGGHVRIEAGGTIALNRVDTRSGNSQSAGSVYLWATGTVTVATSIDTRPGSSGNAGAVTIRSEGPVSGQGIAISGSVNGYDGSGYSILAETAANGANTSAGDVSLYCRTNITLAAGISTRGNGWYFIDGAVLIRGDFTDGTARAGTVSIGGTGGIRTDSGKAGGNVTIRATALQLTGGIWTTAYCYGGTRTGNVDINVLENATIGGSIDTRLLSRDFSQGSPGYVKIVARRTALLGVDAEGYSIRTWPGTLTSPGSSASAAGDADVTLTNVDTSAEIYDPANPTNSMTSSIYVAGKIGTGRWYNDNAMGNIRISAVEVQLVGDLTNSSSTASSIMSIHYGTNAYGVVTHLLENGVRWNGVASHNITYTLSPGTKTFVGDVPYAGALVTAVAGTIQNLSVTNVTQTSATFRGHLQTAGNPASAVSVVWGQTAGNLDSTNGWTAGTWGDNSYPSTNISPLTANTNYYYTFVAANAGGTNAAGNTQYLITGPLTVLTGDGLCGVSATDTASIAISRPGTCVSGPLTVNYALSGAGTGYVSASPASGFTLAAGQASTNITIQPVAANSGAPASVTLTLLPGAYPSDVLGSDSISVGTMVASDVTLTGDVYIDAADGGKLKYVSGGAVAAYAWNGTTLDGETYDYTYQFNNLNLGGYNIHGALNHNQSQSRALFQVSGNVSGGGSFQFHTTAGNLIAGNLRLEAAGSIALSNVWTYVTPNGTAASTYLWAKGGPVTLTGSINNEGASARVAPVVVRSDGPVGSRGITVAGGNSGFSIRTHNGGSGGKPVWLCTEGDITLGGDVVATANGGGVTIRGNYTNAALRAGGVTVHGSIPTWVEGSSINIGYGSGNISVLATNLVVDGSFLTYCQSYNQRGGGIRVDVTGDARFGGYLDTHTIYDGLYTVSSPGSVYILARRTAINGTNTTGHSILTKPSQTSGTFAGSQAGDGNITLTNVDTSTSGYNPERPLQSDTSSLSVSGKVEAAYCGVANIQGDIYLSAVEVQLAGEIATSAGPNSDIAVHYGVTTHGIVTHLVENGTRWNGSDGHSVTYGLATPAFFADVPYLGVVGGGTVFKFR